MLTIVFDLDGTLIDTAPDLVRTLNFILVQEGLAAVPIESARTMIGGGARGMIARALAAQGRNCSANEMERLYPAFIAHYAAHIAEHSRPFPHLETTLDRLAAAGHRLAVCTNKLEWLSLRLLQTLQLARHFAAICGQDTFGVQKPDPEIFRRTVQRAGGKPTRAIMVGDSRTDIDTARAAGVPVVAVEFGYSEVPIGALRPDRLIGSFAALPGAIDELMTLRTQG
jgi:phosphoglycolate phosphatase